VPARSLAPVSRYSKPSRPAKALAVLLFPAPAGPSMVTIMVRSTPPLAQERSHRPGTRKRRNGRPRTASPVEVLALAPPAKRDSSRRNGLFLQMYGNVEGFALVQG